MKRLWVPAGALILTVTVLYAWAVIARPIAGGTAQTPAASLGPLEIPFDRNVGRYPPPDDMAMAPGGSAVFTETRDGFTMRVQPLYADANRVLLRYTVDAPRAPHDTRVEVCGLSRSGPEVPPAEPCRLMSGGQELPLLENRLQVQGSAPKQDYWQVNLAGTLSFDTAAIQGSPASLPLRLSIPWEVEYDTYVAPWPWPTDAAGRPATVTVGPANTPVPPLKMHTEVDFTMPFDARARTAKPGQSSVSNGVTSTLESVVSTESETRLVFRLQGSSDTMSTAQANASAGFPSSWLVWLRPVGAGEAHEASFQSYGSSVPQCDDGGACRITVRYNGATLLSAPWQDFAVTLHAGSGEGKWLFHFKLPPVAEPAPK